jgi:hypothetical protein
MVSAAAASDSETFEQVFADGVWAFSQYDHVRALEYFQKASHLRPEYGFAQYMLGLSYLRLGKAREAAAEIAASLEAKEPPPVERSRVLVDLGAAQLAAGDVQAALGTLEKALPDRQTDAVAFHYYAKVLGLAGRREEAEVALARARLLDPKLDPEDLPVTFPVVTAQAPSSGDGPRWQGDAGFLAGYDSNPNLLSEDLLLSIPPKNRKLVSGRSSDSVASGDLRASLRPFQLSHGWSLAVDLRGEGSLHQDFRYLNVVRTGAVVHLVHGADPSGALEGSLGWARVPRGSSRLSLLVQGKIDELRLDGASYLRISEIASSVLFAPSPENATRLDLHAQDRSYFRHPLADPRLNGQEIRLGVRRIRFLGERDRFVAVGIVASNRNAGSAFDRTLLGGDVEAVFPIASRWLLRLGGSVNQEKFDNPSSNLFRSHPEDPTRKDRTWGSSASLTFEINDRLRLLVRGGYQNRDSNVSFGGGLPALDYRRTLLETGLSWAF